MESDWPFFCKKKLVPPERVKVLGEELRRRGLTVASLNGSFDLLHAGHLHIIYSAAKSANILVCALNTDESIKRYKSEDRPIISLNDRLKMMCALEFVDYVTWFAEDDPRLFLENLKPDVHVNGSEYGHDCIEKDVIENNGGRIEIVTLKPGLSTSKIIERIDETSRLV